MAGIKWTFSADGTQAEQAFTSLENKISGIGESIKGLAVSAFGISSLDSMFEKTVETASELINASERLKIPVEQLQLLRQAAKDAGIEFGKLQSTIEKVNLARDKALGGGADAQKYLKDFERLGISKADLLNPANTGEKLLTGQIASATKSNNADEITSQLKDVLGKSFGEVIPLLQTDFGALHDKMQSLGSIMDTETAVKVKKVGDSLSLLGNILVVQFAPVVIGLVKALLWVVEKIKNVGSIFGATTVGQAHLQGREGEELTFLEDWKRKKGKFKDLMTNGAFTDGMTDANKAVLFKESKEGIDKFVQRRIDYLRTKSGIDGQVANEEIDKNQSILANFDKDAKEEADKLSHPKASNYAQNEDINKKVKPENFKSTLGKLGSNDMLKVGGLLGVDASYRIQRLTEESNRFLRQIAKNTAQLVTSNSSDGSDSDDYEDQLGAG